MVKLTDIEKILDAYPRLIVHDIIWTYNNPVEIFEIIYQDNAITKDYDILKMK